MSAPAGGLERPPDPVRVAEQRVVGDLRHLVAEAVEQARRLELDQVVRLRALGRCRRRQHGVAAIAAGSGSAGGSKSRLREVEAAADVRRVAVALVQDPEPVAVGDQLQDRLVGAGHVAHPPALLGAGVGRDRDRRDAESGQRPVVLEVGAVAALVGDVLRADVVEEPAPLVVVDEHRSAPVLRGLDECVGDVGHERLAESDVAVRVLVGGDPVAAATVLERRVDEADRRQLARRGVGVELRRRADPVEPARPVERGDRQVGDVVGDLEPPRLRPVEDRLPLEPARPTTAAGFASGPRSGPRAGSGGSDRSSP